MMRKTLVFVSCVGALTACGGGAKPATVGNRGAPQPAPVATIATDVAAIAEVVATPAKTPWPQRVTFLGWTADHRVAYRQLICAVDELGGRGDWCDLMICTTGVQVGGEDEESTCEAALNLELYDPSAFVAADTTALAASAESTLGPLVPGGPATAEDVGLSLVDRSLYQAALGQPRRAIIEGYEYDEGDRLGVTSFDLATTTRSPDGACVAAMGIAHYQGEYEGVRGDVPRGFAAVACAR